MSSNQHEPAPQEGTLLWVEARTQAHAITGGEPIGTDMEALREIAERFDATVHFVHPPADAPPVVAFIVKKQHSYPEIYINADEPLGRQRFLLAHEIGHLIDRLLLAGADDYAFTDERGIGQGSGEYDAHEFFADEFASALLMPEEPFLRLVRERGHYQAAVAFGVNVPDVMMWRRRLEENPTPDSIFSPAPQPA